MSVGDKIGQDTVADLNQYVHSWLDELRRMATDLLAALKRHRIVIQMEEKEK